MWIFIISLLGLLGLILFIKDTVKNRKKKYNYYFNEHSNNDSIWVLNNGNYTVGECDSNNSSGSCDGKGKQNI
jgi:hypothetical protein